MLLAGTDKKSLMPSPKLLANPMGLPITPAEPNTCKFSKLQGHKQILSMHFLMEVRQTRIKSNIFKDYKVLSSESSRRKTGVEV